MPSAPTPFDQGVGETSALCDGQRPRRATRAQADFFSDAKPVAIERVKVRT
jgi:hypothetical protein